MKSFLIIVKIILMVSIIVFIGTVLGATVYFGVLKNNPPVAVQPTPSLTPVSTQVLAPTKVVSLSVTSTPTPIPIPDPNINTSHWKTYKNDKQKFELKYPDKLILTKTSNSISLSHSIDFVHSDPCDFKGDAPDLKKITDFNVSYAVLNKNLKDTIIANSDDYLMKNFLPDGTLVVEPGIDAISINALNGYRTSQSFEGCGEDVYYFPLNSANTLVVKRALITEFKPIIMDREEFLKLPNIIPPDGEESLFSQILFTFNFLGNSVGYNYDWSTKECTDFIDGSGFRYSSIYKQECNKWIVFNKPFPNRLFDNAEELEKYFCRDANVYHSSTYFNNPGGPNTLLGCETGAFNAKYEGVLKWFY